MFRIRFKFENINLSYNFFYILTIKTKLKPIKDASQKIIKFSQRGRSTSTLKKYKSSMTVTDELEPSAKSGQVIPMTTRNYTCKQSFDMSEAKRYKER